MTFTASLFLLMCAGYRHVFYVVYIFGALPSGRVFLSHSCEQSKVSKYFNAEVACRRKLQKRMCEISQNVFSATAGDDNRVH
jgi:hypothetical protein